MKNKKKSQKNKLVDSKGMSGKFKIVYLSIALVFIWLFTFFTYTQGENFITFLLISIFFTSILIPIIFHIKKNDKTLEEPINFQKIQENIIGNIRVNISKKIKKIKDTEIIRENNREGFLNKEYGKTFLIIR